MYCKIHLLLWEGDIGDSQQQPAPLLSDLWSCSELGNSIVKMPFFDNKAESNSNTEIDDKPLRSGSLRDCQNLLKIYRLSLEVGIKERLSRY